MKFDIILPTIGRASIHKTIESVLAQEYKEWRLILVFDGYLPPLNEFEYVLNYDVRWCDSHFPHNDSGAWARNTGIQGSDNEWICYIDDDDEYLPNHLTTLVELSKLNPEANMLRTAGQSFSWRHKSPRSKKLVRKIGAVNSTDILTVGMAHTREIFNRTSGWKPEDNHDLKLWQEMIAAGGIGYKDNQVTFQFAR